MVVLVVCRKDAALSDLLACECPQSVAHPGRLLTSTLLNTTAVMHLQGHMVPMDQPAASLDMINRFMQNKALAADDESATAAATGSTQQPAASGNVRQSLRLPAAAGHDSVAVV